MQFYRKIVSNWKKVIVRPFFWGFNLTGFHLEYISVSEGFLELHRKEGFRKFGSRCHLWSHSLRQQLFVSPCLLKVAEATIWFHAYTGKDIPTLDNSFAGKSFGRLRSEDGRERAMPAFTICCNRAKLLPTFRNPSFVSP